MSKIANAVRQVTWLNRLARTIPGRRVQLKVTQTCVGAEPDTFLLREFAERSLIPLR